MRYHQLLVAAASLALFLVAPSLARADEYAVALFMNGDEVQNDASTTCNLKGGCFTLTKAVKNHATTKLVWAAEYNTTTCASISPGTWNDEGTSDPKHGTDTQATISETLTSGACAGHTVKAEQVSYTATATTTPVEDRFAIIWTTPDFKTGVCPTCEIGYTITVEIESSTRS